ncbi:hypothetical protein ACIA5C_37095 [Actinoplanes sp. NPDC051343]|uniref:hypothetical protein n=1 Tax=Actinoplanes sp. NPDC051343 TaxID=3363906 RepID=UPI0037A1592A
MARGAAPAVLRAPRLRRDRGARRCGRLAGWLVAQYAASLTSHLGAYPNTVAGLLYGAVFTALFALSQRLISTR